VGDPDGPLRVREANAARRDEGGGFDGAGVTAAVTAVAGPVPGGDLRRARL
jgi:hypothetical protein